MIRELIISRFGAIPTGIGCADGVVTRVANLAMVPVFYLLFFACELVMITAAPAI
jgi:hypothetical protein